RLAGTTTSRRPDAVWIFPLSTRRPSTSKTRTAPKATSTASENWRRTADGGVFTVVWGDGSVRRSTAWAEAGPAVDTTRASTRAVPATARATPVGSVGRTAGIVAAVMTGEASGCRGWFPPGEAGKAPEPPKPPLRRPSDRKRSRCPRAGEGGSGRQGSSAGEDQEGSQAGE